MNKNLALVCVVIVALAGIGGYLYLNTGRLDSQRASTATAGLIALVTMLLGQIFILIKLGESDKKIDSVASQVDDVHAQVNGGGKTPTTVEKETHNGR